MRNLRELKAAVDAVLAASGGQASMSVLAMADEAETVRGLLKGRHGAKCVTVRVGVPSDLLPIMDRVRGPLDDMPKQIPAPKDTPKQIPEELDYDGY